MDKKAAEKLVKQIPETLRYVYGIQVTDCVAVHNPAYINIEYRDDQFRIEENEGTWDISNSRVSVTLWKKSIIQHSTVF